VKRAGIIIVIIVVALFACRREAPADKTAARRVITTNIPSDERNQKEKTLIKPATGMFLDSARLGAKLGPDGAVAEESSTFGQGEPVYFTLTLHESPAGLQTHAVWLDANGKELGKELHHMNGGKQVTFAMTKPLPPGHYRVEGYWGGNVAADKSFEIVPRPAKGKG
jgi:hypothetical protein